MRTKFLLAYAEAEDEKEAIYRLRYNIFIEELQRNDRLVNHHEKSLKDSIDDYSTHIYATTPAGRVIGALRNTLRSNGPFEAEDAFDLGKFSDVAPKHISHTGRLIIDKEFRMSTLMKDLCQELAALNVLKHDVLFDFLYCKPKFSALYERLGYRRYTSNFMHSDYGYEIPMVLVTDDREYMKKVRSPLLKVIGDAPTFGTNDYFNRNFPQFSMQYT